MSDTAVPTDLTATAQVDPAEQRLLWTGAAANGALILALIGFAGNANDTMAALRMVTIPALIGIAGFSFGGAAITHGLARLAHRLFEPAAQAKIAMAHNMAGAMKEVLTTPAMDAEVARLVWGDQADDQMRALLFARLQAAQAATDNSPVMFNEAMETIKAATDAGIAHLRKAQQWLWASFVAATVAVVVLVGQAWIAKPAATPKGVVAAPAVVPKATQPAVPVAARTAAPAALPPCPGGGSTCKPWERAWKVSPPLGTMVPDQATAPKK